MNIFFLLINACLPNANLHSIFILFDLFLQFPSISADLSLTGHVYVSDGLF